MKASCVCGKRVYGSQEVADNAALDYQISHPNHEMNGYECIQIPGNFHIGHIAPDTSKVTCIFKVPKRNIIRLKTNNVSYIAVGKHPLPLNAKIVNESLNKGTCILIAKSLVKDVWESRSPECSDIINNLRCKTLLLDAWAAENVRDPHKRLTWIKKTNDYLTLIYRGVTADRVNEFVGYCDDGNIQLPPKTPGPLVEPFEPHKWPFWMATSCFQLAKNKGRTKYSYHTDYHCHSLQRTDNKDFTFITQEQLDELLPTGRLKMCTHCAGTAFKKTKLTNVLPVTPVTSELTVPIFGEEITVNNIRYIRADSIPAPVEVIPPVIYGTITMADGNEYKLIK